MKYYTALPYFTEEDIENILNEFRSIFKGGGVFTKGPNVKLFEKEFSEYIGVKYSIAVNSGTSALEIALKALSVKEGDEVIVPVQTFIATGASVVVNNATPVFCEVDENHIIDFEDIKRKITDKTKAVIIVYFAGLIHPEIFRIKEYLKKRNIYLIEDVAHAHGAKINDTYAGNLGDIGCFSFYSTKIMTTAGEGGVITTNDPIIASFCSSIRGIGINPTSKVEEYINIGGNRRMTEFQAITGRYQLKKLDDFISYRNQIADIYKKELQQLYEDGIIGFQDYPQEIVHPYWRFLINLKRTKVKRESLKAILSEVGISIDWPYEPLMHLQPVFKKLYNLSIGYCPFSERLIQSHFCLPIHLGISLTDALFIASRLKKSFI